MPGPGHTSAVKYKVAGGTPSAKAVIYEWERLGYHRLVAPPTGPGHTSTVKFKVAGGTPSAKAVTYESKRLGYHRPVVPG